MSLQVWLPLNGDLHNQGLKNISVSSNNSSVSTNGKIGSCMKITSNTDLGYSHDFNTTGVSFGGWFKFNKSEISSVVSNLTYNSTANSPTGNLIGNNYYGGIGLIWTGNNYYSSNNFSSMTIQSVLRTSSTIQSTSGFYVDFDVWVHIFLTWDPDAHALNLYKNGILFNTKTSVEFSDGVTRNILLNYNAIWGGNGPSASIPMYCNDIRIYDHALSPLEVKHLAQGLVLHYPLNREGWGQENLITQTIISTDPWKSAISGSYTVDGKTGWILANNILYSKSGNGANNIFPGLTYNSNSQYTISFKWRDDYRTDGKSSSLYIRFKYSDGTYTDVISPKCDYWKEEVMTSTAGKTVSAITTTYGNGGKLLFTDLKLEKGAVKTPFSPIVNSNEYIAMGVNNNIVYDTSGFKNNSTLNSQPTIQSDSPRYSASTFFGAVNTPNAILNNPSMLSALNNCSVSWWEYVPASGNHLLFQGQNNYYYIGAGSATTRLYDMNIGESGISMYRDGQLVTTTYSYKSSYNTYEVDHADVFHVLNEWHHFVLSGINLSAWTQFKINTYTSWPTNAYLSDIRIYATALSADDILELYHTPETLSHNGTLLTQGEFVES